MFTRLAPWILVGAFVAVGQLNAETITSWDQFGQPGDQVSSPVNIEAANVSGVPIIRGSGLVAVAAVNSTNSRDWDETGALPSADDNHFEFGFDVEHGYQVLLDELLIATRSSATGPGTIGLFTSLDGYLLPIQTFVQPEDFFVNTAVDLSALPPITGSFRARLIEIGNVQADLVGATGSTGTFRTGDYFDGDDFLEMQFTGEVEIIPEPASALLLCLCALPLAMRRHHNR